MFNVSGAVMPDAESESKAIEDTYNVSLKKLGEVIDGLDESKWEALKERLRAITSIPPQGNAIPWIADRIAGSGDTEILPSDLVITLLFVLADDEAPHEKGLSKASLERITFLRLNFGPPISTLWNASNFPDDWSRLHVRIVRSEDADPKARMQIIKIGGNSVFVETQPWGIVSFLTLLARQVNEFPDDVWADVSESRIGSLRKELDSLRSRLDKVMSAREGVASTDRPTTQETPPSRKAPRG